MTSAPQPAQDSSDLFSDCVLWAPVPLKSVVRAPVPFLGSLLIVGSWPFLCYPVDHCLDPFSLPLWGILYVCSFISCLICSSCYAKYRYNIPYAFRNSLISTISCLQLGRGSNKYLQALKQQALLLFYYLINSPLTLF